MHAARVTPLHFSRQLERNNYTPVLFSLRGGEGTNLNKLISNNKNKLYACTLHTALCTLHTAQYTVHQLRDFRLVIEIRLGQNTCIELKS